MTEPLRIGVDRSDGRPSRTQTFLVLLVESKCLVTVVAPASWDEADVLRTAQAEMSKPPAIEALVNRVAEREIIITPLGGGLIGP